MSAGASTVAVVRVAIGVWELVAAPRAAAIESGRAPDRVTVGAYRLLGGRQIVQGLLTLGFPGSTTRAVGTAVDALHGCSMIALAVFDPPRRRAAIIHASSAVAFAVAGRAVG